MKQSKLITVPIKAKSSKTHPEVHLAYITDKEQDLLIKKDLYGSLKGKPNRGPGGLPSLEGDFGKDGRTYEPAGPDVSAHQATGEGGQKYTPTPTTSPLHPGGGTKKKLSVSNVGIAANLYKGNIYGATANWIGKKILKPLFSRKPKEPTLTEKTAAMEDAYVKRKPVPVGGGPGDRDGIQNTIATQSLVTAPTADKAAGFGHQWNFQAYGNQQNVAANPYDYTKAPYAKKGKLVRKYATGQEIKNFSKGKRSGPPPLKGPDPQGLQTILENSDYFKTLIG